MSLLAGLGLVSASFAAAARPVIAVATGPCGSAGVLSSSGTTNTCTYSTGGEDTFAVPAGVTTLDVTAIGASGGIQHFNLWTGLPGAGAVVENTALQVPNGSSQLWVDVGSGTWPDGGPPGDARAGGGGGSSALSTEARSSASLTGDPATDSRLLVAGGGGGAGQASGGAAGNQSLTGGGAGGCSAQGAQGGVGPVDGTNGGGAVNCPGFDNVTATPGTASSGGTGDDNSEFHDYSSGGGGGGWFGGGGGVAFGGGGGGSSYGGAGSGTVTVGQASSAPKVSISWTQAPPSSVSVSVAPDSNGDGGYTITASALDGGGNVLTSYDDASATWSDANGELPSASSPQPFLDGVSTTTDEQFVPQTAAPADTVTVTTDSVSGTSGSFDAIGPLHQFAIDVPRHLSSGSQLVTVTVTAQDAVGNTVTSYQAGSPQVGWSDTAGELNNQPISSFVNGVSSNQVTLAAPARHDQITVTDDSVSSSSGFINVRGPVSQFGVGISSPVSAGGSSTLTVSAEDSAGNVITSYSGQNATWQDSKGEETGQSLTFTKGVSKGSVTLPSPARQDRITVTDDNDSSITGQTGLFNIYGVVSHFAVQITRPVTAGSPTTLTVSAEDSAGNVITAYSGQNATWQDSRGEETDQPLTFTKGVSRGSITLPSPVRWDKITVTDDNDNSINGHTAVFSVGATG